MEYFFYFTAHFDVNLKKSEMFDRLCWLVYKFISSLQKWPLESSEKYKNSMYTIPKIGLKWKKKTELQNL